MSPNPAARIFSYAQVDVFAEHALAGNPLAIFTDARGLSTQEMQALARETNLCETTFIVPRAAKLERERGVQVRIFTVQEELLFAGHPTLGTASWLHLHHPTLGGEEKIILDLRVGSIPVRFTPNVRDDLEGVFATMRQNDPIFGQTHDRGAVAHALGLQPDDLDPTLPIQTVSTGLAFCIVPLRSLEVAARLAIPQGVARAYLAATDAKFFYCITRAAQGQGADWHARMQFYNMEDPATGSAAGCAIAYLVAQGAAESGKLTLFEQGIEMFRPSLLHTQASLTGEDAHGISSGRVVGGRTIPVASGRFILPRYTGYQHPAGANEQ